MSRRRMSIAILTRDFSPPQLIPEEKEEEGEENQANYLLASHLN